MAVGERFLHGLSFYPSLQSMNKTIEIEVTLLEMTKNYTVEPVAVTGIEAEPS